MSPLDTLLSHRTPTTSLCQSVGRVGDGFARGMMRLEAENKWRWPAKTKPRWAIPSNATEKGENPRVWTRGGESWYLGKMIRKMGEGVCWLSFLP